MQVHLLTKNPVVFKTLKTEAFQNNVEKRENAGKKFLSVPRCFSCLQEQVSSFEMNLGLSSANASNLDKSKCLVQNWIFKPCPAK